MNQPIKSRRRFAPQPRDLQILRYIRDSKTMSLDQIKRRFWPAKTFHACYYRMQDLVFHGVVTKVTMDLLRCSTHYYLTKIGLQILIDHGLSPVNLKLPVPEASDIIRSDFQHNSRVTDIRIVLENDSALKVSNWVSDEEIKTDPPAYGITEFSRQELKGFRLNPINEKKYKYRIPDAIFTLEDAVQEGKVILEYEHGRYVRWKFQAYLANWEECWRNYQKLIVAATPERVEILRSWCLEDLRQRYHLDIGKGSETIEKLASSYLFTDYHALNKQGLTKVRLFMPIGETKLVPQD